MRFPISAGFLTREQSQVKGQVGTFCAWKDTRTFEMCYQHPDQVEDGLTLSQGGDHAPHRIYAKVSMEWALDIWVRIWNPCGQAVSHGAEQSMQAEPLPPPNWAYLPMACFSRPCTSK
jgi:hypothetical protein